MAESCKERQVRVEEEVLQQVDRIVKEQRERCESQECIPWLLCLNKVACWLFWVTLKVTEWVLIIVVRWVFRIVCVVFTLVLGLLALIFTFNPDILIRALFDLGELIIDVASFALGAILLYGNTLIDITLTMLKVKDRARPLTDAEIAVLRPIFGDSILYPLVSINDGRLGIMGPPFANMGGATTMGYAIYFRTYNLVTLVHECMHIWQFQFGGTLYIGQSATLQVWNRLGGDNPYDWFNNIGMDENGWYLMESVEAQAEFLEDLYNFGQYILSDGTIDSSDGAFFREDTDGNNEFLYGLDTAGNETTNPVDGALDFTNAANAAWKVLKTG